MSGSIKEVKVMDGTGWTEMTLDFSNADAIGKSPMTIYDEHTELISKHGGPTRIYFSGIFVDAFIDYKQAKALMEVTNDG